MTSLRVGNFNNGAQGQGGGGENVVRLGSETCEGLARGVGERLRKLSLAGCVGIGDEGVAELVEGCPGLVELDLEGCEGLTGAALCAVFGVSVVVFFRIKHFIIF